MVGFGTTKLTRVWEPAWLWNQLSRILLRGNGIVRVFCLPSVGFYDDQEGLLLWNRFEFKSRMKCSTI
jgi:hypothetical protein